MLSDEERARIEAEESFRQKVRRQQETSEPPASSLQVLWSARNSPFGLWVLSSIVLAFISWGYTTYQQRFDERAQKTEHQRRLKNELCFRIENSEFGLRADEERLKRGIYISPDDIYKNAWNGLNNRIVFRTSNLPPELIDYSVYPEYRDKKFRPLLLELRSISDKSASISSALGEANDQYLILEQLTTRSDIDLEVQQRMDKKIIIKNAAMEDIEKVRPVIRKLQENTFLGCRL